jgi:hypothetical protein
VNDEKFAKGKKPIPWMNPADKLYEVLQQKTRGRILRVDKDWPSTGASKPYELSVSEWKQFTDASHWIRCSSISWCRCKVLSSPVWHPRDSCCEIPFARVNAPEVPFGERQVTLRLLTGTPEVMNSFDWDRGLASVMNWARLRWAREPYANIEGPKTAQTIRIIETVSRANLRMEFQGNCLFGACCVALSAQAVAGSEVQPARWLRLSLALSRQTGST